MVPFIFGIFKWNVNKLVGYILRVLKLVGHLDEELLGSAVGGVGVFVRVNVSILRTTVDIAQ